MKTYLKYLSKYQFIAFWLLVLVLFGLSLYKVGIINQPSPDADYLQQAQTAKVSEIKIDAKLRQELEKLIDTKVDTRPDSLGQADPFNL